LPFPFGEVFALTIQSTLLVTLRVIYRKRKVLK